MKITVSINDENFVGTGFFYKDKETLLTNYHVIKPFLENGSAKIKIEDSEGKLFQEISVGTCGEDKIDICILRIKDHPEKYYLLPYSNPMGVGHRISSIGNGRCHGTFAILTGEIQRINITNEIFENKNWFSTMMENHNPKSEILTTSIPFCEGDSGGPAYESQGKVLGINFGSIRTDKKAHTFLSISVTEIEKFVSKKVNYNEITKEKIYQPLNSRDPLNGLRRN